MLDAAVLDQLREIGAASGIDLVGELITLFAAETPALLASLDQAISAGDADGLGRAAHTLKSTSATVGAHHLATLSAELERLGRSGGLDGAAAVFLQLEHEAARVAEALQGEQRGER